MARGGGGGGCVWQGVVVVEGVCGKGWWWWRVCVDDLVRLERLCLVRPIHMCRYRC